MVMYAADAGGDARRGVGGNDGQQRWATAMGAMPTQIALQSGEGGEEREAEMKAAA